MGKWIDRGAGLLVLTGIAFVYFQATLRTLWASIPMALLLSALLFYMARKLHPAKTERKRPKLSLVSRKRAPWCALYGVLYLALYLVLGYIVYLPLSLLLLLLAGLGFAKKPTASPDQS